MVKATPGRRPPDGSDDLPALVLATRALLLDGGPAPLRHRGIEGGRQPVPEGGPGGDRHDDAERPEDAEETLSLIHI